MSKIKVLYSLVAVLVLLNIGLMGFVLTKSGKHKGHHRPRHNPKELIIKKLDFNQEQITQFEEAIDLHRRNITALEQEIHETKKQLYSNLASVEKVEEEQFSEVSRLQAEIEKTHVEHFLAIKNICKPDQLENYESLTKDLAKMFSGPRMKGRKKR